VVAAGFTDPFFVRLVFFFCPQRPVKPDKIPSFLREEHAIIEIRVAYDAPKPLLMIALGLVWFEKFCKIDTVALSFVFDKYCLIMD